jgi:hypothetical protein
VAFKSGFYPRGPENCAGGNDFMGFENSNEMIDHCWISVISWKVFRGGF